MGYNPQMKISDATTENELRNVAEEAIFERLKYSKTIRRPGLCLGPH